jgi:AraC-like DNA-binding protein
VAEGKAEAAFDIVHARTLHLFPELVTTLGGEPDALMTRAGIATVTDGRPRATYGQMGRLLELAAETLACPDFAMRLAATQGGGMFGPLGTAMRHSRSFGEALDYVCTHTYAHSLAVRIKRHPGDRQGMEPDTVFVSHDILIDGIAAHSQLMEQALLAGHLTAMEMTGGHARARRVLFRHQPVSSMAIYRRYFGCEVRFGQPRDGCVFSERSLASPIIEPDAEAYRAVTAYIDESFPQHAPPLHAEVRGLITQYLGGEHCTNTRIAEELNLHPRTLHRRLKEEGATFQKIKDAVRRDLMLYYLRRTEMDFAHISERLGFAEQSVFTRSCNRWLAAAPTRIRAEARLG